MGGTAYTVDFARRKQVLKSDRSKARRVQRADWLDDFFWSIFQDASRQAGQPVPSSADGIFDFSKNEDFRHLAGTGKILTRGGEPYKLPFGWKRFAVDVRGKFDGGNNAWMGNAGKPGEWAVAYHGTHHQFLAPILDKGLKPGARQAFAGKVGTGVYCTPVLSTAQGYSSEVELSANGKTRKVSIILQCRVRPEAIKRATDDYWVINDPADIRPYGVLVMER